MEKKTEEGYVKISLRELVEMGLIPETVVDRDQKDCGERLFHSLEEEGLVCRLGTASEGFKFFHRLSSLDNNDGEYRWINRIDSKALEEALDRRRAVVKREGGNDR